jgi:hypothetical protein
MLLKKQIVQHWYIADHTCNAFEGELNLVSILSFRHICNHMHINVQQKRSYLAQLYSAI